MFNTFGVVEVVKQNHDNVVGSTSEETLDSLRKTVHERSDELLKPVRVKFWGEKDVRN